MLLKRLLLYFFFCPWKKKKSLLVFQTQVQSNIWNRNVQSVAFEKCRNYMFEKKKNCSSEVTTFVIYDHTVTSISFSKLKTATKYVLTSTIRCNIFYYAKVKYHYCLMPKLQSWIIVFKALKTKNLISFLEDIFFVHVQIKSTVFFWKKICSSENIKKGNDLTNDFS